MQPFTVFDTVLRAAKIAALKSIAFVTLMDLTKLIRADLKAEKEAEFDQNEIEPGDTERAAEDQRQHVKDIGFEPRLTKQELATLYCSIGDELETVGTDKFEKLEPVDAQLERQAKKAFKPSDPYVKAKAAELMVAYKITEGHAIGKLEKRHERWNEFQRDQISEVVERIERLFESASDMRYDDVFGKLPAAEQLRLLDVAVKGLEREAVRLRVLDAKYDWDDMLERANDLEREVNTFVEAKRPLVRKAQIVA